MPRQCSLVLLAAALLARRACAQHKPSFYFQPTVGFQYAQLFDRHDLSGLEFKEATGLAVGGNLGARVACHFDVDLAARIAATGQLHTSTWGAGLSIRSRWLRGSYARLGFAQLVARAPDCVTAFGCTGPDRSNRIGFDFSAGATFGLVKRVIVGPVFWLDHSLGGNIGSRTVGAGIRLVVD